jgi:hypothetical protein
MLETIKRILASLDFKYQRQQKEWHDYLDRRDANLAEWLQGQTATSKARQLAAIARERNALKDELAKVIKAKKARAPIYAALRALSIEELKVEGRR